MRVIGDSLLVVGAALYLYGVAVAWAANPKHFHRNPRLAAGTTLLFGAVVFAVLFIAGHLYRALIFGGLFEIDALLIGAVIVLLVSPTQPEPRGRVERRTFQLIQRLASPAAPVASDDRFKTLDVLSGLAALAGVVIDVLYS